MAGRSTLLENLGIVRLYRSVNYLAWCVRRQFSSLIHRPARASGLYATNAVVAPTESVRTDRSPTEVTTTVVSQGGSPIPPPCQLPCHLEKKPMKTFFQRLAIPPVLDSIPPKEENFPLFATFPAELRVQVWQYVASFERIVEIQYINRTQGFRHSASPRPPAILHVCHESRYEALKVYKLCFGTRKLSKSMYLNLRTDTLFFRVAEQSQTWRLILGPNSLWREQLKFVRRIAFTYIGSSSLRFMKKTVCSFPNLEELIILWAEDAHTRPLAGRGVSYIERIPGHGDNKGYSSWQSAMKWKANIEKEFWWKRFEPEAPVISVRHWCMRSTSEW